MSSKHSSSSDRDRRSLLDNNGPMFQVGTVILNRYQVVAHLGGGGMGEVYRCHDRVSDIDVALKVLPRDLSANTERMNDIRANFKLVECLHHPNIADLKTLEHNPATNDYYMIMEYVHGRTLRQSFKSRKKSRIWGMTLKEALPVLRQIAAALDFAHSQQVVHRDIKPANVMLMDNGTVKVLDFGIASRILIYTVANQGQRFFSRSGTGPYMAPEQWRAQYQDKVTDQYALAVVAYEMLVLEPPFQSPDQEALKDAVLHDNPPTIAHAPSEVMKVLRRALAKKRKDRYSSCTAFVEALAAAGSESERAVPVARATRVRPAKILIGAGIILLLVALGGATWLIWPSKVDPLVCAALDLKKGNFAHALLDAGKVLAKHPDNKQALSLRQEATNLQDLMQKAQSVMQTLKRARELVRKSRDAEAETLVRQVLQAQPGNAEAASLLQEIKKHVAQEEILRAQAEKTRMETEQDRQKLKDRMGNIPGIDALRAKMENQRAQAGRDYAAGRWNEAQAGYRRVIDTGAEIVARADEFDMALQEKTNTEKIKKASAIFMATNKLDLNKRGDPEPTASIWADAEKLASDAERELKNGAFQKAAARWREAGLKYAQSQAKEFEEQKCREEAGKNLQAAMEKARTTMASNKNAGPETAITDLAITGLETALRSVEEAQKSGQNLISPAQNEESAVLKKAIEEQIEHLGKVKKAWSDYRPLAATVTGVIARIEQSAGVSADNEALRKEAEKSLRDLAAFQGSPAWALLPDTEKSHMTNGQRQVQAWLKKTAKPPSAAETPEPTTSPVTNGPMAGKPWKAPGINMAFVWIPVKKGKLWAGKYEVTNGEFRRFKSGHQSDIVDGYDISLNGSRQPVVNVSYGDAEAFAQWLTSQAQGAGNLPEDFQYRLPSGEEWDILAQCGDGRDYPWGNEWPPTRGNYYDQTAAKRFGTKFGGAINFNDGYETTCPVELSDSNDWGLFGVGGNASEWTSEQNAGRRMVRGMSWRDSVQDNMHCGSKLSVDPDKRANNIGFRLVLTGP